MKKYVLAILLCIASPANAQQTYTITITEAEIQLIIQGLLELPGKYGFAIIKKLQEQAEAQAKSKVKE